MSSFDMAPLAAGLTNQGATGYLNVVLQVLFHIPAVREAVLALPLAGHSNPRRSPPLAWQRVFTKMQRSVGKCRAISTKELTQSLGWNAQQCNIGQDADGMLSVLLLMLQHTCQVTHQLNVVQQLFSSTITNSRTQNLPEAAALRLAKPVHQQLCAAAHPGGAAAENTSPAHKHSQQLQDTSDWCSFTVSLTLHDARTEHPVRSLDEALQRHLEPSTSTSELKDALDYAYALRQHMDGTRESTDANTPQLLHQQQQQQQQVRLLHRQLDTLYSESRFWLEHELQMQQQMQEHVRRLLDTILWMQETPSMIVGLQQNQRSALQQLLGEAMQLLQGTVQSHSHEAQQQVNLQQQFRELLDQLQQLLAEPEKHGWPTPDQKVLEFHDMRFTKAPAVLVMQLERHKYDEMQNRHMYLKHTVEFPEFLDLQPYCYPSSSSSNSHNRRDTVNSSSREGTVRCSSRRYSFSTNQAVWLLQREMTGQHRVPADRLYCLVSVISLMSLPGKKLRRYCAFVRAPTVVQQPQLKEPGEPSGGSASLEAGKQGHKVKQQQQHEAPRLQYDPASKRWIRLYNEQVDFVPREEALHQQFGLRSGTDSTPAATAGGSSSSHTCWCDESSGDEADSIASTLFYVRMDQWDDVMGTFDSSSSSSSGSCKPGMQRQQQQQGPGLVDVSSYYKDLQEDWFYVGDFHVHQLNVFMQNL